MFKYVLVASVAVAAVTGKMFDHFFVSSIDDVIKGLPYNENFFCSSILHLPGT